MFQTHDLTNCTVEDLETIRKEWKQKAEQAITPLLEALASAWKSVIRTERTRRFYDFIGDTMTISTYRDTHNFDAAKGDYLDFLNIQITCKGEPVAILIYNFYVTCFKDGQWQDAPHLFARPGKLDWLNEIMSLCIQWESEKKNQEQQADKKQREKLLNLLTKGIYA